MKLSDQLRAEWALIDQPKKWKRPLSKNRFAAPVEIWFYESLGLANDVANLFCFENAIKLKNDENTTHSDMRIFYKTMIYIAEQCE